MQDEDRMVFPSDAFYVKGAEEMQRLFQDCPEAVENTVKIAQRCLDDDDLRHHLGEMDADEVLPAAKRNSHRSNDVASFVDVDNARHEVARVFGHEDESMAEKLCWMAQEICDGN